MSTVLWLVAGSALLYGALLAVVFAGILANEVLGSSFDALLGWPRWARVTFLLALVAAAVCSTTYVAVR
jgi:hypothetical protein